VDWIIEQGAVAVIPPHPSVKQPRDYDKWLYRERHLIEGFINKTSISVGSFRASTNWRRFTWAFSIWSAL
jgi:hypothetical protein